MLPPKAMGTITYIAEKGNYTLEDTVLTVEFQVYSLKRKNFFWTRSDAISAGTEDELHDAAVLARAAGASRGGEARRRHAPPHRPARPRRPLPVRPPYSHHHHHHHLFHRSP